MFMLVMVTDQLGLFKTIMPINLKFKLFEIALCNSTGCTEKTEPFKFKLAITYCRNFTALIALK